MTPRVVILGILVLLVAAPRPAQPLVSADRLPSGATEAGRTGAPHEPAVTNPPLQVELLGGAPQHNPALITAPATGPYQSVSGPALIPAPLTGTPAHFTSQGSIASGIASWFDARGDQAAVPWWKPGQDALSAEVCAFDSGTARCVAVLITGFCQCLVGTDRERAIDLSRHAFAQLADPAVGLIVVQIEIPTRGPQLPATDRVPVQ